MCPVCEYALVLSPYIFIFYFLPPLLFGGGAGVPINSTMFCCSSRHLQHVSCLGDSAAAVSHQTRDGRICQSCYICIYIPTSVFDIPLCETQLSAEDRSF